MKKFILTLFSACLAFGLIAQPSDKKVAKIAFEMVDGEYEDAAYKAEKLLDDSEYRKNGWAYYYLAQAYYEIAKRPEFAEEYPKALKDALKATYKLSKYRDEDEENMAVYNESEDFRKELKDTVITISEIYYDNDNPRKAAYYLKKILKYDEDDYALWLMKGVYEIKSRNIGEGIKSIMLAMDSIDENYVPDEESAQTMVDALEEYALILQSGEYERYFSAYKFEPTQSDIDEALAMKEEFKKFIKGPVVDKEDRKKESETIFKTFRSEPDEEEED
ncbi:MAG: hypothetical protein CMP59_10095 [Flavobacteriales bacterium]|nr:hypothetical protein [Flavobacteriales bacterium]